MNHMPPNKKIVSMIILIALMMLSQNLTSQTTPSLPRVGRTITQNAAAYFGMNRQDASFDSARVRSMNPLTIEHVIGGRVIETRVFTPQEQSAFIRYLQEYETLMVTVPDPFIADSTLRPVLRYAQPIKSYRNDPAMISVKTTSGAEISGRLIRASPSVVAIGQRVSADSVSRKMVDKKSVEFVSVMQIDSVWFDENRAAAHAVKGQASTLAEVFAQEEPVEMYDMHVPPELEEIMSMTSLQAVPQRRMFSSAERQRRTGVMLYGGLSPIVQAGEVQTRAYLHQWESIWYSTVTLSEMQAMAYNIGASVQFYLSRLFDLGVDVSATFQDETSAASEPNTGFDAFGGQAVISYFVVPRKEHVVPGFELALRAGVGAAYMQQRMRGVLRTPTSEYVVSDDLSSVNLSLSFGVAPTFVVSESIDVVFGLTFRSFLAPAYTGEKTMYRVGNAGTVGWYQMEMTSGTVSVVDLSLGLRLWL